MLDLLFIVMNVSRPLISVGQLNKDGFMVDFGKKSTIRQGGVALPVVGHNGLFYLVATPETMTTSLLRTTLHAQRELLLLPWPAPRQQRLLLLLQLPERRQPLYI